MSELLALSDRIIVFCEGRVTGELSGDDMTEDKVMRAAAVGAHEHLGRSPEA
jgi:ABC-type sugar transport system ATPase subunit